MKFKVFLKISNTLFWSALAIYLFTLQKPLTSKTSLAFFLLILSSAHFIQGLFSLERLGLSLADDSGAKEVFLYKLYHLSIAIVMISFVLRMTDSSGAAACGLSGSLSLSVVISMSLGLKKRQLLENKSLYLSVLYFLAGIFNALSF